MPKSKMIFSYSKYWFVANIWKMSWLFQQLLEIVEETFEKFEEELRKSCWSFRQDVKAFFYFAKAKNFFAKAYSWLIKCPFDCPYQFFKVRKYPSKNQLHLSSWNSNVIPDFLAWFYAFENISGCEWLTFPKQESQL